MSHAAYINARVAPREPVLQIHRPLLKLFWYRHEVLEDHEVRDRTKQEHYLLKQACVRWLQARVAVAW